ncbi:hypothetical protein BDW69DRAFT_6590 [Aspergillus filifer]
MFWSYNPVLNTIQLFIGLLSALFRAARLQHPFTIMPPLPQLWTFLMKAQSLLAAKSTVFSGFSTQERNPRRPTHPVWRRRNVGKMASRATNTY